MGAGQGGRQLGARDQSYAFIVGAGQGGRQLGARDQSYAFIVHVHHDHFWRAIGHLNLRLSEGWGEFQ